MILALYALACADPAGGTHGAIEVTGYLDGARVSLVTLDGEATAMGREGAATPGADVVLEDSTTGDQSQTVVGALGAFAATIPAHPGDALSVRVSGASADDELAEVLAAGDAFPDTAHLLAYPDPQDPGRALVEVRFYPGRLDGEVWAADVDAGSVAVLAPFDGGALHGGTLEGGASGDSLVLTWVTADAVSAGLGVVVGP